MNSKNITSLRTRNSINHSPLRHGLSVIALVLTCLALSPVPKAFGDSGTQNTATGSGALCNNTSGGDNTADGFQALESNTTGYANTATGSEALENNSIGYANTATGYDALYSSTSNNNTATGYYALYSASTGGNNTAVGSQALYSTTTANHNTASGYSALFSTTAGFNNTAIGSTALYSNTTGSNNIAVGQGAGSSLTTGSSNIDIGNSGTSSDTKAIRIGFQGTQTAAYVAGIYGTPVVGSSVVVTSSGQLGVSSSSKRFKSNIKSMDEASEVLLGLRPVTFRYKPELDSDGAAQFGLVAEEVEKVDPALVVRDSDGKPFSVRYEAVNAMLLNEFLKEHQTVQDLKTMVAQQKKQIEVLTAGLQKVSAQLEVNKSRPQVAINGQ
jgi:hypothetical protein